MGIRHFLLFSAGCMALAGTPALAQSVGVTAAVNQSALGTAPSAKPRTMVLGDKVIHDEKIETNGQGLLQILLADGTSFTVGPNSSMAIDSFVYDPSAGTAKVVATLGKGVFRFIGGKTSKSPDGAVLNTPVGTVGIRGGIGDFDFHGGKGIPIHIDMLFGDSITLTNHGSVLGRIFEPGFSIAFGPNNQIVIQKTPAAWTANFQHNVAGNGSQHGGTAPGHGVSSTAVASALGGTNSHGPNTSPPGTPPTTTQIASFVQPPPVPFTPPDLTSGNATWAEINNSALAGVEAIYSGASPYQETIEDQTSEGIGSFALGYYFGKTDGGGVYSGYSEPEFSGNNVIFPVTALQTNGSGDATFVGHIDPGDDVPYWGNMTGTFINTKDGVAQGVTGGGDFYWHSTDDHVVGTFTGALQQSAPIP
jgi:hypothetical protein